MWYFLQLLQRPEHWAQELSKLHSTQCRTLEVFRDDQKCVTVVATIAIAIAIAIVITHHQHQSPIT